MRSESLVALASLTALSMTACIDAAQEEVRIPLSLAGRAEAESFESARGFRITLSEAELAFGPLYLCAGATAGTLCETALSEWTDAAVLDALRTKATRVGELSGLNGQARSWMYDLGLVSLLTQDDPKVLDAAGELAGHSVRLKGNVTVEGIEIPFRADLAIQQTKETEKGTPVVRSGKDNGLDHTLANGDALTVRFDAREWFQTANFARWIEDRTCEPKGAPVVCSGQTELTCDADGATVRMRDCADRGEVCIAGQGCVEEVVVDPESQVGAAIRIDLTSASAPEFRWSR